MIIFSHRGLDPDKKDYYLESSRESFLDQVKRGYGLEFDLQPTQDGEFIIFHDSSLERISGGDDTRRFNTMKFDEILKLEIKKCHLIDLVSILKIAEKKGVFSAIHVKYLVQTNLFMDKFLEILNMFDCSKIIIFDLIPEFANYLKKKNSNLILAASVSHPYDIERYGKQVGGTLLSVDEIISYKSLYDWAWLDEWDRSDRNGGYKSLYNTEVFDKLRKNNFKIAVVSPELHGSSPGLLGGEFHQDADDRNVLLDRLNEIISIKPDAICTDYPDLLSSMKLLYV